LFSERSFTDFVKLNALPGTGLVLYAVYTTLTRESRPPYELLVIYFGLLCAQYLIRQGLVKRNLLQNLDGSIKLFEGIVGQFRTTCHRFDPNPPPLFLKYIDDAHDLIVGSWLDLLKRVIQSRRNEAGYPRIARWVGEFVRIVQQYHEKVVRAFIDRADAAKVVTRGTKREFAEFRMKYNEMADKINELAEDMSLQKVDKIAEELEVQEAQ